MIRESENEDMARDVIDGDNDAVRCGNGRGQMDRSK
jgi:hypothetical protein